MPSLRDAVYELVAAIPPGEVMTYGEVAAECGFPGAARAVGTVMARSDGELPWWRVVAANGRLVPGHEAEHTRRLRAEGVAVRNGRVAVAARARNRRPRSGSR
jgi:alkylated DNA nucleotide flippase Atl1